MNSPNSKSKSMTKPKDVDDYINNSSQSVRSILTQIRETIKKAAPEAEEKISYGMPTFTLNGNLVHFAAFSKHIGFYPTPSSINAFGKELTDYKTSKGAIRFPLDEPIPYSLITEIVKFRVKENLRKK